MAKMPDQPSMKITDDEGSFIHAGWSRSGKRVILSVGQTWDDSKQVELRPHEARELAEFLCAAPERP
jgi:hypothetical protein